MSPSLLELVDRIFLEINDHSQIDTIADCPASVLIILSTHPGALIKLAHSKIHSFPFSKVPLFWRRIFTDASIIEAIRLIRAHASGVACAEKKCNDSPPMTCVGGNDQNEWIQPVVTILDMAVIIAGAPERTEVIKEILAALQVHVSLQQAGEPPNKRRRREDVFSTVVLDAPRILRHIPKQNAMSMEQFENHLPSAQPIVMQNAFTHWPASHERPWNSPAYLMKQTFGGRRLVPVEIGRSYTDEEWGQSIITFKEFMEYYLLPKARNNAMERTGYVAQHDLFTQIPALRNDISIPDYCYTEPPQPERATPLSSLYENGNIKLEEPVLNAWFGPAGTVSPLHTDPYHNILCQVVGKKYVRLYNSAETPKLYPRSAAKGDGLDMSNTSHVDVEGDLIARDREFPLFKTASYLETILEEGECLYIPVGWWHYIRSLTVSFSVSFWWN